MSPCQIRWADDRVTSDHGGHTAPCTPCFSGLQQPPPHKYILPTDHHFPPGLRDPCFQRPFSLTFSTVIMTAMTLSPYQGPQKDEPAITPSVPACIVRKTSGQFYLCGLNGCWYFPPHGTQTTPLSHSRSARQTLAAVTRPAATTVKTYVGYNQSFHTLGVAPCGERLLHRSVQHARFPDQRPRLPSVSDTARQRVARAVSRVDQLTKGGSTGDVAGAFIRPPKLQRLTT